MRRAGATLIESLVLLAFCAVGATVASYGAHRFGWPGFLLAFRLVSWPLFSDC